MKTNLREKRQCKRLPQRAEKTLESEQPCMRAHDTKNNIVSSTLNILADKSLHLKTFIWTHSTILIVFFSKDSDYTHQRSTPLWPGPACLDRWGTTARSAPRSRRAPPRRGGAREGPPFCTLSQVANALLHILYCIHLQKHL